MSEPTIYDHLRARGYTRREFLKLSAALAGALGLEASPLAARRVATARLNTVIRALQQNPRQPLLWLSFQDCAGCTEALTRSAAPTLVELLFNTISLDYHETLAAASGSALEGYRQTVMAQYAGQYVLVVEGSVPGAGGGYCTIGGRSADDILREVAVGAKAIVATGSCASFGGLPAAAPNPTSARAVHEVLDGKTVVHVPGCPAIPEVTTGVLVHLIVYGTPPELDALGRPLAFYGQTIHERCERRPFFRREQFARAFDDAGARQGWCLFELGCKGPETYNACPVKKWGGLSFPVQSGHPCLGCSEPRFWDQPFYPWRYTAHLPNVRRNG